MSIPSNPVLLDILQQGMILGGRLSVSATETTNMQNRGFQSIKTEIWMASRYDVITSTETLLILATGNSTATLPADFDHEESLRVYYCDESRRSRATGGTAASVTLSAAYTEADNALNGYYIFYLAGTGVSQYAQITQNVSATRIASLSTTLSTPSDATTDYMIGTNWRALNRANDTDFYVTPFLPKWYRIVGGTTLTVWPPPDRVYPILMIYTPNLTRLDEGGSVFVRHLRERRSLWVQGVVKETMKLYDDDRYPVELQNWNLMLAQYGSQNPVYDRVPFGSR